MSSQAAPWTASHRTRQPRLAWARRAISATGSDEVSHVLSAMGYPDDEARGALRLTVGRTTTDDDIDEALAVIPSTIQAVREGARAMAGELEVAAG